METKEPRPSIKQRAIEEAENVAAVTAYLFIFLATMASYRNFLLAEYGLSYARVGYSIVEALVIAKVIILGELLRVGEGARGHRMVVTILYKTFAFALLVAVFKTVEDLVAGYFHGHTPRQVLEELFVTNRLQTIAQTLLMFVAFVPFFTLREIARALGKGRLKALLLSRPA